MTTIEMHDTLRRALHSGAITLPLPEDWPWPAINPLIFNTAMAVLGGPPETATLEGVIDAATAGAIEAAKLNEETVMLMAAEVLVEVRKRDYESAVSVRDYFTNAAAKQQAAVRQKRRVQAMRHSSKWN